MKKRLPLLLFLSFITSLFNAPAYAHEEWVHQYALKEAYRFLEKEVGPILPLMDGVGMNLHGPGSGSLPYDNDGPIGVGVWREDLEDHVYGYNLTNAGTASVTHFWDADAGDQAQTSTPIAGNVPNAWQKAQRYLYPTLQEPMYITGSWIIGNNMAKRIKIFYSSLADFYNGNYTLVSFTASDGREMPWGTALTIQGGINHKKYALHVLGRVAHLLQDMSVPAHAHGHMHPCPLETPDYYENQMGGVWGANIYTCESDPGGVYPAQAWSHLTAKAQGGLINSIMCMPSRDAMRYLFFTQNQIADFYPSGVNTPSPYVMQTFQNGDAVNMNQNGDLLTMSSIMGLTSPNTIDVNQIANNSFNFAIRSTASLLYRFAKETGMVPNSVTLSEVSPLIVCPGTQKNVSILYARPNVAYAWSSLSSTLSLTVLPDGLSATLAGTGSFTVTAASDNCQPSVTTTHAVNLPSSVTVSASANRIPRKLFGEAYAHGTTTFNWYVNGVLNSNHGSFLAYATPYTMSCSASISLAVEAVYGPNCTSARISVPIFYDCPDERYSSTSSATSVYPNPATDQLTIESPVDVDAELYDKHGKMVKTIKAKSKKATLSTSSLPSGTYILKVNNGQEINTHRVMVQ